MWPVWPDWAISETSWCQNFLQKYPKYWVSFWATLKTSFLRKNCCVAFWATFGNFGQHLIRTTGHTGTQCASHMTQNPRSTLLRLFNELKFFDLFAKCSLESVSHRVVEVKRWEQGPCLVVIGKDWRSGVREFKSQHEILHGHFFALNCCKMCIVCLKRPKNKQIRG